MCQCTPNLRTPWCGKGACKPPPEPSRWSRTEGGAWLLDGEPPPPYSHMLLTLDVAAARALAGTDTSAFSDHEMRVAMHKARHWNDCTPLELRQESAAFLVKHGEDGLYGIPLRRPN